MMQTLHTHRIKRNGIVVTILLAAIAAASVARADESVVPSAKSVLNDAGLYFTAPLHWDKSDWLYFGGAVAAIGVAYNFDDNVRNHFVENGAMPGKDPNSTRDAVPAVLLLAGTFAYAAVVDNRSGYREGWTMAEAAGFTAVSSFALKAIAGRSRPNDTDSNSEWFSSGDSFPSMHTSLTFAIGTVLAESGPDDYRWVRRIIGYGAGAAVAYARVHDNVHWLSDVVAGGALGMATAHFVMNRREPDVRRMRGSIGVAPLDGGMMLTYAMPLR
jgi:membrane-associated phospholipid phosphatase